MQANRLIFLRTYHSLRNLCSRLTNEISHCNPTQASRQFGTFSSVMRHAGATYSVPWTDLRAGAIDVIMRAHGVIEMQKHK